VGLRCGHLKLGAGQRQLSAGDLSLFQDSIKACFMATIFYPEALVEKLADSEAEGVTIDAR